MAFLSQLIPELDFKLCSVKAAFTGHARNVELTLFLLAFSFTKVGEVKIKRRLLNLRKLLFQPLKGIDRKAEPPQWTLCCSC